MKTKLLKKLRNQGRNKIHVCSITTTNGRISGASYSYTGDIYDNISVLGTDADGMRNIAMRRYLKNDIEAIRAKYKKYSRKNKKRR